MSTRLAFYIRVPNSNTFRGLAGGILVVLLQCTSWASTPFHFKVILGSMIMIRANIYQVYWVIRRIL